MKKIISAVISLITILAISSCSNGSCNTVSKTDTFGTKLNVSISGATQIQLTESNIQLPYTIKNNTLQNLTGLSFSVVDNKGSTNVARSLVTIDPKSITQCANIKVNSSCQLLVNFFSGAKSGSITIIASMQSNSIDVTKSSLSHLLNSVNTNTTTKLTIGLDSVTNTNGIGADGIAIIYDSTISKNTLADGNTTSSNVAVTLLATSPNVGSFESLSLQDSNGNTIPYTTEYGDVQNLQQKGGLVIINLDVPPSASQISFKAVLNNSSTSTNQSNLEVINLIDQATTPTAILQTYPVTTTLSESNPTQVVTVVNTGNSPATNISVTENSFTSILNDTCTGMQLNQDATCTYTITSKNTGTYNVDGSNYLKVSYFDGNTNQSIANIVNNAQNTAAEIVGLEIQSSNTNYNFVTTTGNSTYTSTIELTNTGNQVITLQTIPDVPNYSITGCSNQVLNAGEMCILQVTYTNSTVGNSVNPLTITYTYQDKNGNTQSANASVLLTSETTLDSATVTPNSFTINFDNIDDDNTSTSLKTITLTNNGLGDAINLITTVQNNASLFSITNNTCSSTLTRGSSCDITVKFGPSSVVANSLTESAILTLSYKPNSDSNPVSANIDLSGQIIHEPTFFVAADGGIYKISLVTGTSTQVYSNSSQQYTGVARYGNIVVAVGTNAHIATSQDNGVTWSEQQFTGIYQTSLTNLFTGVVVSNSGVFELSGAEATTAHSTDGINWTADSAGTVYFTNIAFDQANNFIISTSFTQYSTWGTVAGYKNMTLPVNGMAIYYAIDATPSNNYLVAGYNGTMYLSTNQGGNGNEGNWTEKSMRVLCVRNNALGNDSVNSIKSSANITIAVGNCGYTIYSTDEGNTWTQSTYPVNDTNYEDLNAVAFVNNSTWVAVGANGMVHTSTDGINWSVLKTGLNVTFRGVSN